jgi:YHS domain-containing protein
MKIPLHVSFSSLVLAVVLGGTPLQAAPLSISASEPKTGILAFNTAREPKATIGLKNDGTANQWQGFTFTVSKAVRLDKIVLPYAFTEKAVAGAGLTISIIQVNDEAASFKDTIAGAKVLQTDHFAMPATIPAKGYFTFDLTDIKLPASTKAYGFILRFDDTTSYRLLAFVRGNNDVNPKGPVTYTSTDNVNAMFRSDDGGATYYNLGSGNLQQFYLLGSTL